MRFIFLNRPCDKIWDVKKNDDSYVATMVKENFKQLSSKSRNFCWSSYNDDRNNNASTNANANATPSTVATYNPPFSFKPKKFLSFADDKEEDMIIIAQLLQILTQKKTKMPLFISFLNVQLVSQVHCIQRLTNFNPILHE